MKDLTQFLQHLKDEVLSPFSEIEVFSISEVGDIEVRLLARRGDVTVLPHHKARLHFVPVGTKKYPVRCLGMNCPVCEYVNTDFERFRELAGSYKAFFYALRNGKIVILSVHLSFLEALYGTPGNPSDVTKLALEGVSVFDPENGHSLIVKRESTDTGLYWHVRVNPKSSSLTKIQKEDLMSAPCLSESYVHLDKDEMNLLCRFLEGRTTEIPLKMRQKKRRAS